MMNYQTLSTQPRPFLAMTGLTVAEFRDLLPAFEAAYDRACPIDQTAAGQPRQRWWGAGRHSALAGSEDKLLFILVYLKTYPLQGVLGQLFGISTTQANFWLHRLLPVLRSALDDLGALPERDGSRLARRPGRPQGRQVVIIEEHHDEGETSKMKDKHPLVIAYTRAMQRGADGQDELLSLFHDDGQYVEHFSGQPQVHRGRPAIAEWLADSMQYQPPDISITIDSIIIDGETIRAAWTCESSAFESPPVECARQCFHHQ